VLKRFVLYVLPLYLIGLELALRFLLDFVPGKHEDYSFSSPSLAAASLILLSPCLIPKPVVLTEARKRQFDANGWSVYNKIDRAITDMALVMFLLFSSAWGYCLFLSHQQEATIFLGGPLDLEIAVTTYVGALLLTEAKEAA
jgi:hypothetical protein